MVLPTRGRAASNAGDVEVKGALVALMAVDLRACLNILDE